MQDSSGVYHMFASRITENCGLNSWSTNSEIVRAVADVPVGPYAFKEVVVDRFAHEPNLVVGTAADTVILLGTMNAVRPTQFNNCTPHGASVGSQVSQDVHPARNTYMWSAASAEGIAKAPRQLVISAPKWDTDPLHNGAICDTNAAATVGPNGSLVGLWRRCETANLHTVPHTFTATDALNATSYQPNITGACSVCPIVQLRGGRLLWVKILFDVPRPVC
eukprot:m.289081 g.289081  ORF g.289081 m.289081 type:complete len:221 (+) comp19967_c1_seq17:2334-2996(+)